MISVILHKLREQKKAEEKKEISCINQRNAQRKQNGLKINNKLSALKK